MIELLKTISDVLDEETRNIIEHIQNDQDYKSSMFSSVYKFDSLETRPGALRGKAGVYVFIFRAPVTFSVDEVRQWNSVRGAKFKDYKEKRLEKGVCLYVGSCDSIYRRMTDHFNSNGENTGLKLRSTKRQKALNSVEVYAFPLKCEYRPYSSIVLREIEKRLHNFLLPVAGSSRV